MNGSLFTITSVYFVAVPGSIITHFWTYFFFPFWRGCMEIWRVRRLIYAHNRPQCHRPVARPQSNERACHDNFFLVFCRPLRSLFSIVFLFVISIRWLNLDAIRNWYYTFELSWKDRESYSPLFTCFSPPKNTSIYLLMFIRFDF